MERQTGDGGTSEELIELEGVTKTYRMGEVEVHALSGVSLSIPRGEMVAIMGPSGSGKSTLMNMIGCLDVPTSGRYLLEGEEIESLEETGWPRYGTGRSASCSRLTTCCRASLPRRT